MAQNFNSHSHGSPPNRPPSGFEDLMGSLRSPGLVGSAAALQQGFPAAHWPMQWQQTTAQSNFPYGVPNQMQPINQDSWNQNSHDGYLRFDQEEDDGLFTIDDTELLQQNDLQHTSPNGEISGRIMQTTHNLKQAPPGDLVSLSPSSPLSQSLPRIQEGTASGRPATAKSPMVSNAATTARAAELRAKLLASRGSKSRQASPAVKTNGLSDAKKSHLMGILKQHSNGNSEPKSEQRAASNGEKCEKSDLQASDASPARTTTSLSGALEDLMTEARNAADAPESEGPQANDKQAEEANAPEQIESRGTSDQAVALAPKSQTAQNKSRSPSELSEPGEIRSEAGTPKHVEEPKPPSKPAGLNKTTQANRENQEKLARQNEVKKAYQPLKKPKIQKQEPKKPQAVPLQLAKPPPAKTAQQSRKPIVDQRQNAYERVPVQEESRREQHRERARDYDRRDDDIDLRRSSMSQALSSQYDLERDVAARRQKLMDDNSRRAAEYKRNLEEQRAATRETAPNNIKPPMEPQRQESQRQDSVVSRSPQENASKTSRKDSVMPDTSNNIETSHDELRNGEQTVDTVMLSPQAQPVEINEDFNDWLELTEFYDQDYREKRLRLFRKKKALDAQRAELEREEELELQERSARVRTQSVIPVGTPSSTGRRASMVNVRMPPPPLPLPLREANKDGGIKIKNAALSAGLPASQMSSPTLKRQYAEDATEPNRRGSAGKKARLETNGPSSDERPLTSPASVKAEREPVNGESITLESRMSKYDSWAPTTRGRPRSRSPEYRRRSLSPRGRRHSLDYSPTAPPYRVRDFSNGPKRVDERSCFNCGHPGHVQHQCTAPRRDSREWPEPRNEWPAPAPRGYQQWVSPHYRGQHPVAKPGLSGRRSPQPRPGADRSRYNSISRIEDTEYANGGPRNSGPGGQPR